MPCSALHANGAMGSGGGGWVAGVFRGSGRGTTASRSGNHRPVFCGTGGPFGRLISFLLSIFHRFPNSNPLSSTSANHKDPTACPFSQPERGSIALPCGCDCVCAGGDGSGLGLGLGMLCVGCVCVSVCTRVSVRVSARMSGSVGRCGGRVCPKQPSPRRTGSPGPPARSPSSLPTGSDPHHLRRIHGPAPAPGPQILSRPLRPNY